MNIREQIIIVNWRWEDFDDGVNAIIFREKSYQRHLANIEEGKGKYYQEFAVEYSETCPNGKFVSMNIYNDKITDDLFFTILSKYIKDDNEVLLFLHRMHHYKESDVANILEKFRGQNLKCFLIADGRDYIYYYAQKSGLLDDTGSFFYNIDRNTGEFVKTFDQELKMVKQPYFDRVWSHYQYELQNKIFELKEELFACWLDLLLPDQPEEISVLDLQAHLKQVPGRALSSRVDNFLAASKKASTTRSPIDPRLLKKGVNEKDEIKQLEQMEGKSYFFDDVVANINFYEADDPYSEVQLYKDTCDALDAILSGEKHYVTQTDLMELAEKFNQMVQGIPGELSN